MNRTKANSKVFYFLNITFNFILTITLWNKYDLHFTSKVYLKSPGPKVYIYTTYRYNQMIFQSGGTTLPSLSVQWLHTIANTWHICPSHLTSMAARAQCSLTDVLILHKVVTNENKDISYAFWPFGDPLWECSFANFSFRFSVFAIDSWRFFI